MRILVTGGAGYIGSHTCKSFGSSEFQPVTFDNLSTGHLWAVKWGPFVRGDLADSGCIREALATFRPEAVLHFAGSAYVGESACDPAKYYRNNVVNAVNLLDAMRDNSIYNIVFSSTCATYGDPETIPINEDQRQLPLNPYGDSKLTVERAIKWYASAYGMRAVCLRYFNAAGADVDRELGEEHDPETHIIPLALQVASGRRGFLELCGSDYDTRDGTCIRDFTHVSDLARAHVLALQRLLNTAPGKTEFYNLGSGIGHTVREVIGSVERVTGKTVTVADRRRRTGDAPILIADVALAATRLKWVPAFRSLDQIIDTAWKWEVAKCHRGHA